MTPRNPKPNEEDTKLVQNSKFQNFLTRFIWTFVMIFSFTLVLYTGHSAVIVLVGILQVLVFREIVKIGIEPAKSRQLPWFRAMHYYLLVVFNYFLYGESLINHYKPTMMEYFLGKHHRFVSFLLYVLGLVYFVMNLKKGFYRFQFSHFGWTHMALLLIVFESHFIIENIFNGLFWFLLPSLLVVTNDVFAYMAGILFGKTPLISLSPKKTWEGFIGGLIITTVVAFVATPYLTRLEYFTCSLRDYESGTPCALDPIFLPKSYKLWPELTEILTYFRSTTGYNIPIIDSIELLPIQLHALVFALFASLIAPFGGFFASGLKRAFNVKDFADAIPGHGGITDRMDCQFMMGVFANMYFTSFIGNTVTETASDALIYLKNNFTLDELLQVYGLLGDYLQTLGVL